MPQPFSLQKANRVSHTNGETLIIFRKKISQWLKNDIEVKYYQKGKWLTQAFACDLLLIYPLVNIKVIFKIKYKLVLLREKKKDYEHPDAYTVKNDENVTFNVNIKHSRNLFLFNHCCCMRLCMRRCEWTSENERKIFNKRYFSLEIRCVIQKAKQAASGVRSAVCL